MVLEYILFGLFNDGITLTKNYINTNESENGFHGGIYLDEGTTNATVTENVVIDCNNWIDARKIETSEHKPNQNTILNTSITNNYSNKSDNYQNNRITAHTVTDSNTTYQNNKAPYDASNQNQVDQIINNSGVEEIEPEQEIIFTSEKYEITGNVVKNIQPNTTCEELKRNIISNKNYTIKENGQTISSIDTVKTGQQLEVGTSIYTLIVAGDTNGDGKADIKDIMQINKHRLNKIPLYDCYLLAGDVTKDGKVDIKDIMKLNKYRLGKINEL